MRRQRPRWRGDRQRLIAHKIQEQRLARLSPLARECFTDMDRALRAIYSPSELKAETYALRIHEETDNGPH